MFELGIEKFRNRKGKEPKTRNPKPLPGPTSGSPTRTHLSCGPIFPPFPRPAHPPLFPSPTAHSNTRLSPHLHPLTCGPHSHLTALAQPRTPRFAARVAPPSLTAPPGPSVGAARPPPRRTHSLTPRPHMADSSLPSVCSPRSCPLLAAPSCLPRDPLPCGPPEPCRPTDRSASCPPRPSRTYAPAGFRGDRCSIHSPCVAPNPAAISDTFLPGTDAEIPGRLL